MVISDYTSELTGALIIGVSYAAIRIYEYLTRRRLFNQVAEILAKP